MPNIRRKSRWRAWTSASVCLSLACATWNAERTGFITGFLEERAKHLRSADRGEIVRGLMRAERKTGVDALLLLSVMEEESHFKLRARSRRGAMGLMQIRLVTGQDVAERNGIPWRGEVSLFEPSVNILIGATHLAELQERFGSWDLALTAYNQGATNARRAMKRGRNPSSRYADRVLRRFDSLRQAAG
jgi:soluble lytic murein transglycosylase-like protein